MLIVLCAGRSVVVAVCVCSALQQQVVVQKKRTISKLFHQKCCANPIRKQMDSIQAIHTHTHKTKVEIIQREHMMVYPNVAIAHAGENIAYTSFSWWPAKRGCGWNTVAPPPSGHMLSSQWPWHWQYVYICECVCVCCSAAAVASAKLGARKISKFWEVVYIQTHVLIYIYI